MPDTQDYNIFRRYIGDFQVEAVDDATIDEYLDDATVQATAPHVTPDVAIVTAYDDLPARYSPEVLVLAAINYWWNKAAQYSDRITRSVGQASEQASERWQHSMEMIASLQQYYDQIAILGQSPDEGNLSHWNRNTLSRVGGQSEEDAKAKILPALSP